MGWPLPPWCDGFRRRQIALGCRSRLTHRNRNDATLGLDFEESRWDNKFRHPGSILTSAPTHMDSDTALRMKWVSYFDGCGRQPPAQRVQGAPYDDRRVHAARAEVPVCTRHPLSVHVHQQRRGHDVVRVLAGLDARDQIGQLAADLDAERLLRLLLGDDQVAINDVVFGHTKRVSRPLASQCERRSKSA